MNPTPLIKQHQKCIKILVMIRSIEKRMWANHWDIQKCYTMRIRLIQYYETTLNKIQITETVIGG